MTNKAPSEANLEHVTELATSSAWLNLDQTILLGTFGAEDDLGALLRLPSGDVLKVHKGDQFGEGEIIAIGGGHVIIDRTGGTTMLQQPQPRPKGRHSGA
ncbi:hypothetical protein U5922_005335 [Aquicoccus sp. G2-2]|uniref:hypothetical protein n=1 Tax=Aquicoccus sp. G2-2 TaxID=3092120 RepID=UPI002ADFEFE1|nr:hypothetical protein [Aquicoccus sp. G2-2]MEA1112921.1 hypothetical protein [Aquicoccus sp. G2-2]